jgi:hypothetical protein
VSFRLRRASNIRSPSVIQAPPSRNMTNVGGPLLEPNQKSPMYGHFCFTASKIYVHIVPLWLYRAATFLLSVPLWLCRARTGVLPGNEDQTRLPARCRPSHLPEYLQNHAKRGLLSHPRTHRALGTPRGAGAGCRLWCRCSAGTTRALRTSQGLPPRRTCDEHSRLSARLPVRSPAPAVEQRPLPRPRRGTA